MDKLPILDLKRSYAGIKDEIRSALDLVFESQGFILGPEVRAFEEDAENYLDAKPKCSAIGCASGSDALLLALMALDIGPGDEVVTTPYSFFATVSCITRIGATPVFADIDPATYNIDIDKTKEKFTPKTKVFLPVHLFGQMTPIEEIAQFCRERSVVVVEDAAQAFGSWRKVGSSITRAGVAGDVGCYSFFPTKNLGACGDAGLVTTSDSKLASRLRRLRVHGEGDTYFHEEVGLNSRLDAIQAAILRVKLRHLEEWNAERRVLADNYRLLFESRNLTGHIAPPAELEGNFHIYHQYVVRAERRDELRAYLEGQGISARVYYPLPLHLQKCFAFLGLKKGDFPESEKLSQDSLALPIFSGLKGEEQERLVKTIADFYKKF
ncbi:aminotransferase DegT [Synergistales bacterium]|nr:aminotransferase DegT [Synergistales bacterium]